MKKILLLPLILTLPLSAAPIVLNAPQILSYAQQALPHEGKLLRTSEGFVYIKVPNEYILGTLVELEKERRVEAPAYFGQGKVGAHITVIDALEAQGKKLKLPPSGTIFSFTIKECAYVDVTNEHGSKRIYMYIVDAPELEQIRIDNDLPPKVRGMDLHITTAVEYR